MTSIISLIRAPHKLLWVSIAIIFILFSAASSAQNKVVVVPLIGNGAEIKPIRPDDLIERLGVITNLDSRATIGNVTNDRAFVLTSVTVAPEQYPATFDNIAVRFCRTGGGCSYSMNVPNNNITKIDFGLGDLHTTNGQYYIDIPDRGGNPQHVAHQIILRISGYYYDR